MGWVRANTYPVDPKAAGAADAEQVREFLH